MFLQRTKSQFIVWLHLQCGVNFLYGLLQRYSVISLSFFIVVLFLKQNKIIDVLFVFSLCFQFHTTCAKLHHFTQLFTRRFPKFSTPTVIPK